MEETERLYGFDEERDVGVRKKDPYSLFYRLTVESVDKDCLIMYPELKMVTPFPDIAWTEKCGKPELSEKLCYDGGR